MANHQRNRAARAAINEPDRPIPSGRGPGLAGLCYGGLPWFTGAAVLAARVACVVMVGPQLVVIALLRALGQIWHAGAIAALVIGQGVALRVRLSDPKGRAPWYNGTGVTACVSGMMVAAFALRGLGGLG